jgi:hypothetical protein
MSTVNCKKTIEKKTLLSRNNCYYGGDSSPLNSRKLNGDPTESTDLDTYFFRGLSSSDCLQYLIELGIVNE